MKKIIIIGLLFFMFTPELWSQEECKDILFTALQSMRDDKGVAGTHTVYATTSYYNIPGQAPTTDTVELYTSSEALRIQTSGNTIYQNKQITLTVIEDRKLVYAHDALLDDKSKEQFSALSFIQDSLLSRATVYQCETVCLDESKDHNETIIGIRPGDDTPDQLGGFKTITYRIDADRKEIRSIQMDYGPEANLSALEVTIIEFDKQYKNDVLGGVDPTTLLTELNQSKRNYRVIDLRKEK